MGQVCTKSMSISTFCQYVNMIFSSTLLCFHFLTIILATQSLALYFSRVKCKLVQKLGPTLSLNPFNFPFDLSRITFRLPKWLRGDLRFRWLSSKTMIARIYCQIWKKKLLIFTKLQNLQMLIKVRF